jgi:hypothetical protein
MTGYVIDRRLTPRQWMLWDLFEQPTAGLNFFTNPLLYVFLAIGNVILIFWCFGLCVLIWKRLGVDYITLLRE